VSRQCSITAKERKGKSHVVKNFAGKIWVRIIFFYLFPGRNAAEAVRAVFSVILQNTRSHFGKNTAENSKKEKMAENTLSVTKDCRKRVSFSLGR